MTEKVFIVCDPSLPTPAVSFSSPEPLVQWTCQRLLTALSQRGDEVMLPVWAGLAGGNLHACTLQILRAIMEVVYAHPLLQKLTLVCTSEEELSAFRFQWNMWFAGKKPEHQE